MNRKYVMASLGAFAFFMIICLFPMSSIATKRASAEDSFKATLLPYNFYDTVTDYGIDAEEIDDFTPMQNNTIGIRYSGKSWVPDSALEILSDNRSAYVNDSFEFDLDSIDLTGVQTDKLCLNLWIYFETAVVRGLTISLKVDGEETSRISWQITPSDLQDYLDKGDSISDIDVRIFGDGMVPFGWNKISLPFSVGQQTENGIFVDATNPQSIAVNQFVITQSTGSSIISPLRIYDVHISESIENEIQVTEKQDYSAIAHKAASEFTGGEYYKGEMFPQMPMLNEFFTYCWVGDVDYIDKVRNQGEPQSTYFTIVVNSGGGTAGNTDYAFGSNAFSLESDNYTISFCIKLNQGDSSNTRIVVDSSSIEVGSYGNGAWFTQNSISLEIGSQYCLRYKVHSAFSSAGYELSIKSSDDSIVKIVEWNKLEKYIVVEAVQKGSANIEIGLTSDRLNGTTNENGLVNNGLVVKAVKAENKTNSTVILLWVSLGLLMGALVYLAVKAILDSRKVKVR